MMKKGLCAVMAVAMLGSSAFAQNTTEKIRVFKAGAEITVNVKGVPGENASVVMLDPGTDMPDMNTDYNEFSNSVSHVDSLYLDDEGRQTFKFNADKTGIYNIYVRGGEIDYTATNNEANIENPDRIYAESWKNGGEYTHPDLNYRVDLSIADIETFGVKAVAKKIKEELDKREAGRRTIFIERKFSPYYHSDGERIWWDKGEAVVKGYVDDFFKEFSNIGGNVDFMFSDFETNMSMWGFTQYSQSSDADKKATYLELLDEIVNHEKYPILEAELLNRGYDKSKDGDIPLYSVGFYNKGTNYIVFNAVCQQIAMDYYTRAIYEPAKKYFENIKYTDYKMSSAKAWLGGATSGTHKDYTGGNMKATGTHSSPALYSKNTQKYGYFNIVGNPNAENPDVTKVLLPEWGSADFKELLGNIGLYRTYARTTEENLIAPWLGTEAVGTSASFSDKRYRNEMVMHIAIHNPDRILHFNGGTGEAADTQSRELMAILDEVNSLVAYPDRRNLNLEQADFTVPFAISGIYANGRNIWRITPDNSVITGDFCVSDGSDAVKFDAGSAYITFPEGEIIEVEGTASDIGFWVETPEGITPVVEYSDSLKTDAEKASVDFYDTKYGQWTDAPETAEVFDAVASYKGFYGDKMSFVMAKYDENGMLLDAEIKECGIYTPYGNVAFYDVTKDADVEQIKFMLWEKDTLRPLADRKLQ